MIEQQDFTEESPHEFVLEHSGYRVVVHRTDGSYEIIIRAQIDKDPDFDDWEQVLKTINNFYRLKRIAEL